MTETFEFYHLMSFLVTESKKEVKYFRVQPREKASVVI